MSERKFQLDPNAAPVVTAKRKYTKRHLEAITRVFGDVAANYARTRECRITIRGPTRTVVDWDDEAQGGIKSIETIVNHKEWLTSVPTVIHEFAHDYVHRFWPRESKLAPQEIHEATAMFAEMVLMTQCPQYGAEVTRRIKAVQTNPLVIYRQAMFVLGKHLNAGTPDMDVTTFIAKVIADHDWQNSPATTDQAALKAAQNPVSDR